MTGSPLVLGSVVAVGLGIGLAVKVGTDVSVGLATGFLVAVDVGAEGTVGDTALVATEV
jgi:hypothetical protein